MRKQQVIFCIVCVAFMVAAILVGSYAHNLVIALVLCFGAVAFGSAMFFVRREANRREEEEALKNKPDFMNSPAPSAQKQDEPPKDE